MLTFLSATPPPSKKIMCVKNGSKVNWYKFEDTK